jgi:hypothetical protein
MAEALAVTGQGKQAWQLVVDAEHVTEARDEPQQQ